MIIGPFASILLALVLAFFATAALMMMHKRTRKVENLQKRKHREKRLINTFLWKRDKEIKHAATLWGLDNEADIDINNLLSLTSKIRETMGEEFVDQTIQEIMALRYSTVNAIKQLSRRALMVIRTLDLQASNTANIIERFFKKSQVKGDMDNEKSITL